MKHRTTPTWINNLPIGSIFVFGSNLAGRHGKGAAKIAKEKWGAINGRAEGLQGRCYAIPVKDGRKNHDPYFKTTLTVNQIQPFVDKFILFAKNNPNMTFLVIEVGCGLATHTPDIMAPLFKRAIPVENIHLPGSFWKILGY